MGGGKAVEEIIEVVEEVERASHHQTLKNVFGRCSQRNFPNSIRERMKLLLFVAEYLGLLGYIILMP